MAVSRLQPAKRDITGQLQLLVREGAESDQSAWVATTLLRSNMWPDKKVSQDMSASLRLGLSCWSMSSLSGSRSEASMFLREE
jgi:hypothetical protein